MLRICLYRYAIFFSDGHAFAAFTPFAHILRLWLRHAERRLFIVVALRQHADERAYDARYVERYAMRVMRVSCCLMLTAAAPRERARVDA